MIISKNGKDYTVTELKNEWKLSTGAGGLAVEYRVSKNICPTYAELERHVAENGVF